MFGFFESEELKKYKKDNHALMTKISSLLNELYAAQHRNNFLQEDVNKLNKELESLKKKERKNVRSSRKHNG